MRRSRNFILLIAAMAAGIVLGRSVFLPKSSSGLTNLKTPAPVSFSEQSLEATSSRAEVIRVVDGDTVVLSVSGQETKVRLLGINAPESVDPRRPVECFGKEASTHLKEMLAGQRVRWATDSTQDTYDKYGRLLAYLWLPDGTLVNEKQIADGYAYEYTYRLPYEFQQEFKKAQALAQAGKRGLWADNTCGRQAL